MIWYQRPITGEWVRGSFADLVAAEDHELRERGLPTSRDRAAERKQKEGEKT